MKRFLLATASAITLGMAAPAMGQANEVLEPGPVEGQSDSVIEQINEYNSATVSQSVSSDKTGNVSQINQGKYNAASVNQSGMGTLNKSIIYQADENDSANAHTGDVKGAKVVQTGTGNTNVSRVTQKTESTTLMGLGGNTADVWQYGSDTKNTSDIIQDGFSNAVIVWQSGVTLMNNNSTVNQTGHNNTATVHQNAGQ